MSVIAVVGPSGAGKDTLMSGAALQPGVALIRRVITRPAEAGGEDFEGVGEAVFQQMCDAGRFALEWRAHGLRYGIPHPPRDGRLRLVNLSRGVLAQAAAVWPGLSVIHVGADPQVRAARLAARGRETAADIASRIAREAAFRPGGLPDGLNVTCIDNSGDLAAATAAFIAALKERTAP